MKKEKHVRWILLAAIATVPFGTPSLAQVRVGEDGRALDANTRIGSGGYNTGAIPAVPEVPGNKIVTGNVTAGFGFRGNVPYRDAREFRGTVAGERVDEFIADSAGPLAPVQGPLRSWQPEVYYGRSTLAAPPPPGFTEKGFTGIYTPTLQQGFTRPLDRYQGIPMRWQLTPLTPGDVILPGPVDPQTNLPTMVNASPLLGVQNWRPSDLSAYLQLRQNLALARQDLSEADIAEMRKELAQSAGLTGLEHELSAQQQSEQQPNTQQQRLSQPLPQALESPENQPLNPNPLSQDLSAQPLSSDLRSGAGTYNRFAVPPAQQSTQYAELQARLNRYYTNRLQTDEERNREFLKQLREQEARAGAQRQPQAPDAQPATRPSSQGPVVPNYAEISRQILEQAIENQRAQAKAGQPAPSVNLPAEPPQPAKVTSLAEGVGAQGLRNLLKSAEALMQQGKFALALDKYEAAEQVAPNNAMITLGKANAELGAGYFRKAEMNLRTAMSGSPALMLAQYDLRTMIGTERIETIVVDLKEALRSQPDDPGLPLLLAYLAYNTGNESQAASYLDLAQKRAGGKDDFVRLLRQHWTLPDGPGAAATPGELPLSEVLRQFEEANVIDARVTSSRIAGQFRQPVAVPGGTGTTSDFDIELPANTETGPLIEWLKKNQKNARLNIQVPGQ